MHLSKNKARESGSCQKSARGGWQVAGHSGCAMNSMARHGRILMYWMRSAMGKMQFSANKARGMPSDLVLLTACPAGSSILVARSPVLALTWIHRHRAHRNLLPTSLPPATTWKYFVEADGRAGVFGAGSACFRSRSGRPSFWCERQESVSLTAGGFGCSVSAADSWVVVIVKRRAERQPFSA